MIPASMVQTCIEQLGPLTTTDLAALWWPLAARRTVQHYLAQYVAAGALVAHRRSCATGSVVRRIDTVYSLDGVRPIEPRPLGRTFQDLIAVLRSISPARWVACSTLAPPHRGRVLLSGHDPHGVAGTPVRWTRADEWPHATGTWLVIDATIQQPLNLDQHRRAAQWYTCRCDPANWSEAFALPTPLLITRTPAEREAVGIVWRKAWPWTDILVSDLMTLDGGWNAPVWWRWKRDRRRQQGNRI